MTAYEFWMPLALMAVFAIPVLWLRHEGRKLDARIAEYERKHPHHPAE